MAQPVHVINTWWLLGLAHTYKHMTFPTVSELLKQGRAIDEHHRLQYRTIYLCYQQLREKTTARFCWIWLYVKPATITVKITKLNLSEHVAQPRMLLLSLKKLTKSICDGSPKGIWCSYCLLIGIIHPVQDHFWPLNLFKEQDVAQKSIKIPQYKIKVPIWVQTFDW